MIPETIIGTYLMLGIISFLHIGYRTEFFVQQDPWRKRILDTFIFIFTWYSTFVSLGVQKSKNRFKMEEQLKEAMK